MSGSVTPHHPPAHAEPSWDVWDDETLASRSAAGDDAALGELLERYRPFVRMKTRSYFLVGADREDVIQEGMIGLYKAVRDFDRDHTATFRSFADLCITRQIISAVKSATRHKHGPLNRSVSLDLPAGDDDEGSEGSAATVADRVAVDLHDPAESVVHRDELSELRARFGEVLSELEADVLRRYVAGHTYQEIAEALNRQVKSIDNALQRIKRKVDEELGERIPERV